jgi:hypothetical protein
MLLSVGFHVFSFDNLSKFLHGPSLRLQITIEIHLQLHVFVIEFEFLKLHCVTVIAKLKLPLK